MPKLSLGRPTQRPPEALAPAEWQVLEVVDVHDGDTLTVLREKETILSDWLTSIVRDRKPVKLRLCELDTPELWNAKTIEERGQGLIARDQLSAWIVANMKHGLGVTVLGDGGWSRILCDLHTLQENPVSASSHMRALGWPAYVRGR